TSARPAALISQQIVHRWVLCHRRVLRYSLRRIGFGIKAGNVASLIRTKRSHRTSLIMSSDFKKRLSRLHASRKRLRDPTQPGEKSRVFYADEKTGVGEKNGVDEKTSAGED